MTPNEERADRAHRVLDIYEQRGGGDPDDHDASITDLIADLLHLAELHFGGAQDVHRIAWSHFAAESREQVRP